MKHNKQWRSWSEWVANEFRKKKKDDIARINLKPEPFVRGFMNLLCTCDEDGKNKPQLKAINDEIWGDVSDAHLGASVGILKNYARDPDGRRFVQDVLKVLHVKHALSDQNPEQGLKGAYRLTFLVSRNIQNDFTLVKTYVDKVYQRQPKIREVELEDISVDEIENFIQGNRPNGKSIAWFNNEYGCTVTVRRKKKRRGGAVAAAKIMKVVNHDREFDHLERRLKELARGTLIAEVAEMEVDRNVSAVQNVQAVAQASAIQPGAGNTQPFVPQTTLMDTSQIPQAARMDAPCVPKKIKMDTSCDPKTTEMDTSSSQTTPDIQPQAGCLVHSAEWMSTFQFLLNQFIDRNLMEAKDGNDFSMNVCTCQKNTDTSQFFNSELDVQTKIKQVTEELKSWRNGVVVLQRFFWKLENDQEAKTWQSLLKFVHHFLELKAGSRNGAPSSDKEDKRGCRTQ